MVTKATNLGAREALREERRRRGRHRLRRPLPPDRRRRPSSRRGSRSQVGAGTPIERIEMSAWKRILDLLIDPNIIALMLSLGLIGIVVELWNPGLIFPGTVGAISLIVGLYGLQVLPVSFAGLLLMLLAAAFFVAEAFVASHGALVGRGRDHLRDRRADAVRPGRRRLPGLAAGRARDRRHAHAALRLRADEGGAGSAARRPRWARTGSSARRPRCAARAWSSSTASSGARAPPTASRCAPGGRVRVESVEQDELAARRRSAAPNPPKGPDSCRSP